MAANDFLNAYLIVGEDQLKREFVTNRLVSRIEALGDMDFNKDVFVGGATHADQLIAACQTIPFCCDWRLVIVKEVDKTPKEVQEAIVEYLADPCPTTILALVANKLAKNTRLYKAVAKIDKKAVIDCAPKKSKDFPSQVSDLAKSNGLTIEQNAIQQLIGMVGESTVRIDTEFKKIAAALGKGAVVTAADVARFVSRTQEVKPWELSDAMAQRDTKHCLVLLQRIYAQGTSVHALLPRCVQTVRDLLYTHALQTSSSSVLAQELGKQEWQVRNYPRWARAFKTNELREALEGAAALEMQMKSGGNPELLFERWLVKTCTGQ